MIGVALTYQSLILVSVLVNKLCLLMEILKKKKLRVLTFFEKHYENVNNSMSNDLLLTIVLIWIINTQKVLNKTVIQYP